MIETLSVSLTGPALSLLLYENAKTLSCQEGFLLGEMIEQETTKITDNDQPQVHISRIIRINAAVPCPESNYFYDSVGRINVDKIRDFLGDLMPNVVAWYKYKPSSAFKLTFREKLVHKQLASFFNLPKEYFSCCLMISEASDNCSTHSFKQTFVRCHNQINEELPLHIVNLSDPNNSYIAPQKLSGTISNIFNGLKLDYKKTQGIHIITNIQNALQKHTDYLVEQLAEAEATLFQLESEYRNLKSQTQEELFMSGDKLNNMIMESGEKKSEANNKNKGESKTTPGNKPKKNSPGAARRTRSETSKMTVTRSMRKL